MTQQNWTRFLLLWAVFTAACTPHAASPTPQSVATPSLPGLPGINDLDTHHVSSLMIARTDAARGESWSVRLSHPSGTSDAPWKMESTDQISGALADTAANDGLIQHLLDALHDLKKLGDGLQGPPSNFGLDPPQWALRINDQTEIRFGSPLKEGGVYASLGGKIYGVAGSALELLNRIQDWSMLRHPRVLLIDYDDINEVEFVFGPGAKKIHWKRNPSTPEGFPPQQSQILHTLSDLQIQHFYDSPAEIAGLQKSLNPVRVLFFIRHSAPVTLRFGESSGHHLVSASDRGTAIFEMDTPISALLHELTRGNKNDRSH